MHYKFTKNYQGFRHANFSCHSSERTNQLLQTHYSSLTMNIIYPTLLLCAAYYICASKQGEIVLREQRVLTPREAEDPIANSPDVQSFKQMVEMGCLGATHSFFNLGNDKLKRYYIKHLISLGDVRLAELVNDGRSGISWLLQIILVHANQNLLDKVFNALKDLNDTLVRVASSAELACITGRFVYLLKKIDSQEDQGEAVEKGISALFNEDKAKCLDPLLATLRQGTFLNKNLENIAIDHAFWKASEYQDSRACLAERFFDHPVISAKRYSIALYSSYMKGYLNTHFHWLLERADGQDLEAVRENDNFSTKGAEFREAVEQTLKTIGSDVRPGITRRRLAAIQEALGEDFPIAIINIIKRHYLEW